jgi:hypothetical protein
MGLVFSSVYRRVQRINAAAQNKRACRFNGSTVSRYKNAGNENALIFRLSVKTKTGRALLLWVYECLM